jgi:ActR/RegA family two-component response regulator
MDAILVVDDDRLFLTLVREELGKAGFAVLTAENAEEALQALKTQPVKAAIIDVVMPGTEGLELLPLVRKDYPNVPVVVVSGRASFLTGVQAMRLGAVDFLRKPLNFDELLSTVHSALKQGRAEMPSPMRLASLARLQQGAVLLANLIRWDMLGAFLKDSGDFFRRVIDVLADVLGVEIVSLMLVQEGDGTLRIAQAKGLESDVQRQAACRVGEGIAGSVAERGEPLLIRDLSLDPRFAARPRHPRYRTNSLISVPVKVNGKTIGVMNANNKVTGEAFDEHDLAVFTTFACLVSLSLATAQLFRQVTSSVEELAGTNARLARANAELEARVKELQTLRGRAKS